MPRASACTGRRSRDLSVVARDHQDEGRIGSESTPAPGRRSRIRRRVPVGRLGGYISRRSRSGFPERGRSWRRALAAELGEVAGHVAGQAAGDLKATLMKAGMSESDADEWRARLENGRAILLGVHARTVRAAEIVRRFCRKTASVALCGRSGMTEHRKTNMGSQKRIKKYGKDRREGPRMAVEVETGRFTVGVFQDIAWAEKGIDALRKQGLAVESLSIIGKASPEMAAFIERQLGAPQSFEVHDLGPAMARGPLVAALQGSDQGLTKAGIAGTMRRVGFQAHDGRIFHVLTGRGGVLVAIHSEPRAADALAVLHSYGGGNAAIGAWTGRV